MILQKLNQIDIKDAAKYLKSIDLIKIIQSLEKGALINVGVIVGTILLSIFICLANQKDSLKLKQELTQLDEKATIAQEYEATQTNYVIRKKNFPKSIPTDELMEKISELGTLKKIQILSLSPSRGSMTGLLEMYSLKLSVTSPTYANIVNFIKGIEELPYAIRIKEWSGTTSESTNENDDESPISSEIEIESLKVKL